MPFKKLGDPTKGIFRPLGYPIGAPGFSPLDLSPLVWFKAGVAIFTDVAATVPAVNEGDNIAVWQDQSGNGLHAIEGTAAQRPELNLNILNGLPQLHFGAEPPNYTLTAPLTPAIEVNSFTAYQVLNPSVLENIDMLFTMSATIGSTGSNHFALWFPNDNSQNIHRGTGAAAANQAFADTLANYPVLETTVSGVADTNVYHSTALMGTLVTANNVSCAGLHLGSLDAVGDRALNGGILEFLLFPTAHSDDDRALVTNFLESKFAL